MTTPLHSQTDTYWRTVSFSPAPAGWRLLSLFGERRDVRSIAGWLLQHQYNYTTDNERGEEYVIPSSSALDQVAGPVTRVIPGICVGGWNWEVEAITLEGGREIWKVLGPGDADPTDEEWEAEIQRRAAEKS